MAKSSASDPNLLLAEAVQRHQAGDLAQAIRLYRKLVKRFGPNARTYYLLGTALSQQGELIEGVYLLGQSLALAPDQPVVWSNRAAGLQRLKRYDEALEACARALALDPACADAYVNRGNVLLDLGQYAQALQASDQALALSPDFAEAHCNRGSALQMLARWDDALAAYDRAIALSPRNGRAYSNRAAVLLVLRRLDAALADADRALDCDGRDAEAYVNRGMAHKALGALEAAAADFDHAVHLRPDYPAAHWNKALLSLLRGDFATGWKGYEWRWRRPPLSACQKYTKPLWLGDRPLSGKTVLLHAEQGLGDTIQFCRYVPMVQAVGARVILQAPAPLLPLLASLPGAVDMVLTADGSGQVFDLHCPLMSLPLAFATRADTIPTAIPYLSADADHAGLWHQRLGQKKQPRIGLCWSGRAEHVDDAARSMTLDRLQDMFDLPFDFHIVQKDIRSCDQAIVAGDPRLHDHSTTLTDFADTAALIGEMDLVLTVDSAIAHLAGAMGKPVWLLLPWLPDWRWQMARADSPWYPGMRLWRQQVAGDWAGVLDRVMATLKRDGLGI